MMTPRRSVFLGCALALACLSCDAQLRPREDVAIDAWLNCDECRNGERAAVRAIGFRAVPRLEDALEEGPSRDRRVLMRRKFDGIYTSIAAANAPPASLVVDRAAFVGRAEENYVANYQKRAALALHDIGGSRARAALQAAAADSGYRQDVRDVIRNAAVAADTARFLGTVTPTTPAYGDTVVVHPPASEPFDGNELVAVDDSSACSPDDPPIDVAPDRLRFLIAGGSGARTLFVCNVGVTSYRQRTRVVIRTVADLNDRRMATCPDYACQVARAPMILPGSLSVARPYMAKLTLWHRAGSLDTVDFFRLEPAVPTTVTARLDWNSPANLDLRWRTCSGAEVGNTLGSSSNMPEQTTQLIPARACWLLQVYLRGPSTELIHARLRVTRQ